MSDFMPALKFVLDWEDPKREYQPIQDSNGAAVVAGINAADFPIDFEQIAALPQPSRGPAIATFYYKNFWAGRMISAINSQAIASKLMDMAVNEGWIEAVTLIQRGLPGVSADGMLGPITVNTLNNTAENVALASICAECEQFYRALVQRKPQDAPYLNGWLARGLRLPQATA